MDDGARRPSRGRIPAGLIGAIAILLAVEPVIAHKRMASLSGSQWGYEVARSEADSGARGSEVLAFGDSLLKQGLAPTVIEASSGLRAYNFALGGGQAAGSYFLLRRALESGSRPSAVVLEVLPKLMATHPDYNLENWPMIATPAECLEMAGLARDPHLMTDLGLRSLVPSIRCRNTIRGNIRYTLDGTFSILAGQTLASRRNWERNRGAQIVASRPDRVEDLDAWMFEFYREFACLEINRVYIEKLLDLAAEHHVPVFWVLPPYKPVLQARCEQTGFDSAHESFVRSIQARHPGLYVIDGRRSGYDPRVFTDLHHLGREGAATFSADVATLLRRHLDRPGSTPRWIKLPDYRPTSTTGLIEEMAESMTRVNEVAARDPNFLGR